MIWKEINLNPKKSSKEKANNNNKKLENNIINTPGKYKINREKKDKSNNILTIENIKTFHLLII